MPSKKSTVRAPLTFDLSESLLKKVDDYRRKSGLGSNSEVIRSAIQAYNFSSFRSDDKAHRQISVRIDAGRKKELLKIARQKKASVGELLRAALEELSEPPVQTGGARTAKKGKMVKKQTRKKTAKKAASKKKTARKKVVARAAKKGARTAKKAVKKTATKKTAAKKAKKKTARKTAAKKGARKAVKKTAAKKGARKAVKKTATKKTAAKKAKKKTARKKRR